MARSLVDRFWAKVRKSDGCWLWIGAKNSHGYGYFAVTHNWIVRAHRIAFELTTGPVPVDLHVLHRCDVRACVNPAHLFLGTQLDNVRDMVAKGRSAYDRIATTKLAPEAVRTIRSRCASGEMQCLVALDFGVNVSTVHRIVHGRSRLRVV